MTLGELLSKKSHRGSSIDNSAYVVMPGGDSGNPDGTPEVYMRRVNQEGNPMPEQQVQFGFNEEKMHT